MGLTHAIIGVWVGIFWSLLFGFEWSIVAFALLGALFPDIDTSRSALGRKVKFVGWLAKHRGFFHSLLGGVFFTVILKLFLQQFSIASSSLLSLIFFSGYLSHLLFDSVTKEGTQFFYPANIRIASTLRVGSSFEWVFVGVLLVGLVLFWL